ncbi:hypothetical protein [Streptomyces sp. NPDC005485]|uniref:hypothetical protein n=1 Tax=Streptomyces sp. NPDC005485 TaxID=3155591 RepID=UPI0033A1E5F4
MRRTARVLSATALAGAVLGVAAPAASADPAAEVSPSSVAPGGSVTVSVSCDATGGAPPDFIDATSQGFADGKVRLNRVAGDNGTAGGASYSGTARIPPGGQDVGADAGADGGPEAVGPDVVGPDTVGPDAVGPDAVGSDAGPDGVGPEAVGPDAVGPDAVGPEAVGPGAEWGVDGVCPVAPGGKPKQWTASYTVDRGSGPSRGPAELPVEPPVGVQHGVRGGTGGAFTRSLPALITGGVLVAGACGAAVYRVRRRGPSADG